MLHAIISVIDKGTITITITITITMSYIRHKNVSDRLEKNVNQENLQK